VDGPLHPKDHRFETVWLVVKQVPPTGAVKMPIKPDSTVSLLHTRMVRDSNKSENRINKKTRSILLCQRDGRRENSSLLLKRWKPRGWLPPARLASTSSDFEAPLRMTY
jgi:hypothetical protein